MSSTYALIRLLLLVFRVAEIILEKAAEREKAGNLEAVQAAVELSKKARTKEEAQNAARALKDAFTRGD